MRRLTLLAVAPAAAIAVFFWLMLFPVAAAASDLVRPLSGDILLGFNSGYQCAGQTRYHTGVDIAGQPGARVNSAGAGVVTFCGRVPGPAGSGQRVLAVTVKLADSRLATYLPLLEASVARGQEIAKGAPVGTLAETGDGSSVGTHLHLSVRENGNYVDPSPLPIAAPPQTSSRPAPQPQGAPVPERGPLPAPHTSGPLPSSQPAFTTSGFGAQGARPPHSALSIAAADNRVPRHAPSRVANARPDQVSYRARLLRANRRQQWVDPRILELATQGLHARSQDTPGQLRLPSVRVHSAWLMAIAGTILAAASLLGAMSRKLAQTAAVSPRLAMATVHTAPAANAIHNTVPRD